MPAVADEANYLQKVFSNLPFVALINILGVEHLWFPQEKEVMYSGYYSYRSAKEYFAKSLQNFPEADKIKIAQEAYENMLEQHRTHVPSDEEYNHIKFNANERIKKGLPLILTIHIDRHTFTVMAYNGHFYISNRGGEHVPPALFGLKEYRIAPGVDIGAKIADFATLRRRESEDDEVLGPKSWAECSKILCEITGNSSPTPIRYLPFTPQKGGTCSISSPGSALIFLTDRETYKKFTAFRRTEALLYVKHLITSDSTPALGKEKAMKLLATYLNEKCYNFSHEGYKTRVETVASIISSLSQSERETLFSRLSTTTLIYIGQSFPQGSHPLKEELVTRFTEFDKGTKKQDFYQALASSFTRNFTPELNKHLEQLSYFQQNPGILPCLMLCGMWLRSQNIFIIPGFEKQDINKMLINLATGKQKAFELTQELTRQLQYAFKQAGLAAQKSVTSGFPEPIKILQQARTAKEQSANLTPAASSGFIPKTETLLFSQTAAINPKAADGPLETAQNNTITWRKLF